MILFGFIQLFFIIAVTYYEYKNKSPIVFMWATLLIMFGVMHVISYMLPDYQYASVLNKASAFVILFCIFYLFVRAFSKKVIQPKEIIESNIALTEERILAIGKVILIVSVLIYAYFVIRTSGSLFSITKENIYRTMAGGSKLFLLSTYMYYASASLFLYCLLKKRKKDAIIIAILILMRSFLSSSRMDMVILFVGIISFIILNSKKQHFKNIIVLSIIGVVALFAIYALRAFRYYYNFTDITNMNLSEFIQIMINSVKNDDGELGLRNVFYYFLQKDNNFEGFGTGNGYKRVLMFMIPGSLAGELKPEDMCLVMGRAWKPDFSGIINFSVTPTLFGDCYANFGFWGCLMGGVWALIGTLMDGIINRRNEIVKIMLWGLIATEFIIIGRGSVYNPICHIGYCGIIIAFLYFAQRFRFRFSFSKKRFS